MSEKKTKGDYRPPDYDMLTIHENDLTGDCVKHPKMSFYYGKALAAAERKLSTLKNNLKVLCAQIVMAIQQDPKGWGIEKVTEKTMDAATETHPEVAALKGQIIEAEEEVKILQGFVYAIVDRKAMIENLVKLHGQQYWSKPTLTGEEQAAADVASQSRSAGTLNNTMNSNRRNKNG